MSDIATLGLAVDSRPVTAAAKELDKLSASAKSAEQAAANLGKTATPATGAIQAAAKRASISVDEFRARMAKASESVGNQMPVASGKAQDASQKLQKAQAATIANYETLIGKSYLLSKGQAREAAQFVALRKANTTGDTEYGKKIAGLAGALFDLDEQQKKTTGSNLNLVNSLTRRFIVGYAISQVRALVTAVAGLNAEVARVGDLSKLTGFGDASTQGVLSAAGNKGITNDVMAGALTAFNQQIPLAKAGVGDLATLLRANKITVTDTGDAFFKVADLIKNAANDTARLSILQQAGLPATLEMARLMGQGADAIKDQANNALKLGNQQIEAAQKIRDKWDENWQRFKDGGTLAIAGVISWMQRLGRTGDQAIQAFNPKMLDVRINNAIADVNDFGQTPGALDLLTGLKNRARKLASTPTTKDAATEKAIAQDRISKAQQYLGLLGSTTTAMEAQRAVELQLQSAALNGVGIDKTRAETLKRLAVEQNLGITAIRASVDAANIENETIGMSVGKTAEYAAVQNALNEAKRNGKSLTADNIDAIRREAAALGEAAQRVDDNKFAYDTLLNGPLKDMRSALSQGASAWDAIGKAATNALNKIADKLIDMGTQQLWQAAFGGKGTGGLGGLGSIFSGLFGGGPSMVTGGAGPMAVPTFAKGGVFAKGISDYSNQIVTKPTFFAKGGNVMGEAGPEAVMPLVRTPGGNLGVRSTGGAAAPGPVTVVINNAPAGTTATSKQTAQVGGGTRIDVTLKRTVDDNSAALIDSGESAMNKSLERRYGLRPNL